MSLSVRHMIQKNEKYDISVRSYNEVTGQYSEYESGGLFAPTIPTFLVHGLSDNADTWSTMKTWLEANGRKNVFAVDNLNPCGQSGESDFSKNAGFLADYIHEKTEELSTTYGVNVNTINIIGHSMGGLISRRYISPSETGTTTWTSNN